MLSDEVRRTVAQTLATAERDREPVPPLRETWPDLDVVDSYSIQLLNIADRLAEGANVRGHKVGLSSAAMQQMMGVNEPDYGHLLSDMEIYPDDTVSVSRFCMPRVEVEVAFVLARTLPGEGCTEEDVLACTDHVTASIELIDSRITNWDIQIADTVADNASSAGFILGATQVDPLAVDLTAIEAQLMRNGEKVAEGRSDAVLGNPVTAVAWLARKVASFGVTLEAGHVIMPGSVHRAIDANAGDEFEAVFTDLGSVQLSFTE